MTKPPKQPSRTAHTMDVIAALAGGSMDDREAARLANTPDSKGLLPQEAAALHGAVTAGQCLSAIQELNRPPAEGERTELGELIDLIKTLTVTVHAVASAQEEQTRMLRGVLGSRPGAP